MLRRCQTLALGALTAIAFCQLTLGQTAPPTILEIEVENYVNYFNDVADYSKLATDANKTTVALPRNFAQSIGLADIVSVNGQPAKGVFTDRRTQFVLATNPSSGQAIADAARSNIHDRYFEILKPDGTLVGTIMMTGRGGGSPPPGAPSAILNADFTIIGGTGAFLGVRGQAGGTRDPRPEARTASMTEDPANRRSLGGGGLRRFVLQLIPLSRPEVVTTTTGPAVVHANDYSLVTAAKPAKPGEILSLFATGLGPTRPGVDPGKPFTTSPVQVVNSPVEVIVNGAAAEVLYAGGYPGTVDGYQVNFRLPSGITPGQASLQVSVAWIAGSEMRIAIGTQ